MRVLARLLRYARPYPGRRAPGAAPPGGAGGGAAGGAPRPAGFGAAPPLRSAPAGPDGRRDRPPGDRRRAHVGDPRHRQAPGELRPPARALSPPPTPEPSPPPPRA